MWKIYILNMCDIEVDFVNGHSYKGLLRRNIGDIRSVPQTPLTFSTDSDIQDKMF